MKFYPAGEAGSSEAEQGAGREATPDTPFDEPQAIDLDKVLPASS
jgi:hypothetical protein